MMRNATHRRALAVLRSIDLALELPHPPEAVWRALTDPDLLGGWLMSTDLHPALGCNFTFCCDPAPWWDGIVSCQVVELEPLRRLAYTWRSGPAPEGLDTVVTWTLQPTAAGTALALTHTGFEPTQSFAYEGTARGWARMVREALPALLAQA